MVAASLWGSDLGLLVILAVCFVAVFLIGTMLVGGSVRKKREMSLARRLGRGRRRDEEAPEAGGESSRWVPSQLADVGQRFAVATGFSASLDERLERAGMPMLSGEFITMIVLAGIAGAVFGGLVLPNIIFALVVAVVFALIPYFWLTRALQKRQNALNDQLADTLSVLASSLRAGYSFLQALDTVSKEIGEPSDHEFQRVVAEIRLGRPIDDALIAMATRIGSDDLKWAVIAINVQRQVGGNLAEVLDIVANTVRERAYIRRQIKVLSAEGRYSIIILTALPILLLLYQAIVNPDYVKLLFTTDLGLVMLVVGVSLIGAGVFWMTRLVKIDV
jgi:tight adherence protein B